MTKYKRRDKIQTMYTNTGVLRLALIYHDLPQAVQIFVPEHFSGTNKRQTTHTMRVLINSLIQYFITNKRALLSINEPFSQ